MECCIPESLATLKIQQAQLMAGSRDVQMFPVGTAELELPGFARHVSARGVFHFRPERISNSQIETLSQMGRENEFLNLGPFSKADVVERVRAGEQLFCLTESKGDVEIRSAAATESTLPDQLAYFERTQEPGSTIGVRGLADVLTDRLRAT